MLSPTWRLRRQPKLGIDIEGSAQIYRCWLCDRGYTSNEPMMDDAWREETQVPYEMDAVILRP